MPMTRPLLASTAVYLAFTAAIARDVVARLSTGILSDRGDPVLNAGILAWNATHLPWTDAWFNFPGFHPAADTLTFSEHLLGLSVVFTPLYWLTGDAISAYNLTALATYVLCGMTMFALVWRLTHSGVASFVAGFAFAFAPYKVSQIAHVQALAAFWAPLALLGLHGFVSAAGSAIGTRWRWLALFAVAWLMQGAANGYLLVFFSVLVALWVAWFVLAQGRWRDLLLIAAAAVVAAAALTPILLRFVATHARNGFTRAPEEILRFSADVSNVGCAAPGLTAWGWLAVGVCGGEQELFPGIALPLLCLVAGAFAFRRHQTATWWHSALHLLSALIAVAAVIMFASAAGVAIAGAWEWGIGRVTMSASSVEKPFTRGVFLVLAAVLISPSAWRAVRAGSALAFYATAAVVMWMFTWGPAPTLLGKSALAHGPYGWLLLAPGVDGLRVPARFWMLTLLCVCVVAGILLARLRARRSTLALGVAMAATLGMAVDGWTTLPAANLLIRAPQPDVAAGGVMLTLPIGEQLERDAAAQFDAVAGGWRSVNGYSGYAPSHYELLIEASRRADPSLLSAFAAQADLHVLVYEAASPQLLMVERYPGARLVGQARGLRQFTIPRQGTPVPAAPGGARVAIAAVAASCGEDRARLAHDGNADTRWECGSQQAGQTITAELEGASVIGQVVVDLGPYATDYPRELALETSLDGAAWMNARTGTLTAELLEALSGAPSSPRIVIPFDPREARHVRLRLLSANRFYYWSVGEVEVWTGSAGATAVASTRSR